ncbi:peptidoglycan DD-metalloendopeptidase family protein [Anaerotignum faecicola]
MKKDKIWALFISVCLIISTIPTQAFAASEYIWPTSSHSLLRGYHSKHKGIDINVNGANVYASKGGTVAIVYRNCSNYSGYKKSGGRTCEQNGCKNPKRDGYCNEKFGNGVIIRHDNGTYAGYAHMSTVSVERGQRVEQGDLLGVSGSSGMSSAPHLHFYISYGNAWGAGNRFYNPETLLNGSGGSTVAPVTPVTPSNKSVGTPSKPTFSVNNNDASVTVKWNSVANATHYDVYLVQEPWRWEDIKYSGSTQGTSYTFTNVKNGAYKTFVIARPNTNYVKSDWTDLFSVKKVEKLEFEVVSSISYVDISANDFCLRVGETKKLKAGVGGFGSISLDKTWSSSNSNVASVDSNGLVTAKNPGTATIKAVSVSDSSKYDTVEVEVVATSTTSNNTPTTDKTFKTPKPEKTAVPSVSVDGATVSVSWNSVTNATKYDVYLVEDPWRWEDIKYSGSTQGTSYTFNNVREGVYCAFVVSRPNSDSAQSPWKGFNVNAVSTSTADFYNINASNVTQTNAQLNASISYSGNHPSEVGVYFGNSADSMRKVGSDAINHNKNPFDMWYSLNKYGVTLSAGTTYYYKMYAIMDGREVTSNVQSFTTPAQVNSNLVTARVSGTPGGLAINSQPNQYTKIGRMDEGVYCTIDLSRTSGNWYYVTYNGVSGYAYNRYLVIQ